MKDYEKDELFFKNSTKKLMNPCLETENCSSNQKKEKGFFGKWSENTLYDDVKKRIHSKIKTEVENDELCFNTPTNNHNFHVIKRPKSKLTISTLQISIDPMQRRVIEDTYHNERKILHQPQQLIEIPSCQPLRIVRNLSSNMIRQTIQLNSIVKKEKIQTCRKNTKSNIQFTTTLKDFKSKNQLTETQTSQFANGRKLTKSKSLISKSNSTKNVTNIQNANTKPLLFFFRTKNSMKQSQRQMSIKRIRLKSNNNKVSI